MDEAAFKLLEGLTAQRLRDLRIRRMNAEGGSTRDNITDAINELDKLWAAARHEQKGGP